MIPHHQIETVEATVTDIQAPPLRHRTFNLLRSPSPQITTSPRYLDMTRLDHTWYLRGSRLTTSHHILHAVGVISPDTMLLPALSYLPELHNSFSAPLKSAFNSPPLRNHPCLNQAASSSTRGLASIASVTSPFSRQSTLVHLSTV